MDYILVVDDSNIIISTLEQKLYDTMNGIKVLSAHSLEEARGLLAEYAFKVAVLDIHLPDGPQGEVVDVVSDKGIPVIVLTGSMDHTTRQMIVEKNILEFVAKNELENLNFVAKVVKRILSNYNTKVLVVDDSAETRKLIVEYLRRQNLQVYEATNGQEAIEMIEKSKNSISMVVTDYRMPQMDGMELTMELRERYNKEQLSIIALSSTEDSSISTQFLKRGANDFVKKPFSEDELSVRVNTNLEMLDLLKNASDVANRDYLTGAYNRRFFFESGNAILKKAIRNRKSIFIAMLDIDHFKMINDTYGHDIGDEALKAFSAHLNNSFRSSDLVARFGGEEFCVLLEDIPLDHAIELFEKIRLYYETHTIEVGPHEINFTISIGVFHGLLDDLDHMIKEADMGLYTAKNSGRNKIVVNDEAI